MPHNAVHYPTACVWHSLKLFLFSNTHTLWCTMEKKVLQVSLSKSVNKKKRRISRVVFGKKKFRIEMQKKKSSSLNQTQILWTSNSFQQTAHVWPAAGKRGHSNARNRFRNSETWIWFGSKSISVDSILSHRYFQINSFKIHHVWGFPIYGNPKSETRFWQT